MKATWQAWRSNAIRAIKEGFGIESVIQQLQFDKRQLDERRMMKLRIEAQERLDRPVCDHCKLDNFRHHHTCIEAGPALPGYRERDTNTCPCDKCKEEKE